MSKAKVNSEDIDDLLKELETPETQTTEETPQEPTQVVEEIPTPEKPRPSKMKKVYAQASTNFITEAMAEDVWGGMIFQEFLKKYGYSYRVYNLIKSKEVIDNG